MNLIYLHQILEDLIRQQATLDHADVTGKTPLFAAIKGGHDEVIDILIQHGADIEMAAKVTSP